MAVILIVDDSQFSRKTLRSILEAKGHEVHEAPDAMSALEQYALVKPDLVFMDLVMKEVSGLEAVEKLKEIDPNARIVVATADIQLVTRNESLAAGAVAFVNKPFNRTEIQAVVERHARKAS